jgi:hypothetical protein
MAAFRRLSRAELTLERRLALKSVLSDKLTLRHQCDTIVRIDPGKPGDSAECEQFDAFPQADFILNSSKAKNERLCLKCGIFT